MKPMHRLLEEEVVVIHFGLQILADALKQQDALGCHVDWSPPMTNNPRVLEILRIIQTSGR